MSSDEPVTLTRDVEAAIIPVGDAGHPAKGRAGPHHAIAGRQLHGDREREHVPHRRQGCGRAGLEVAAKPASTGAPVTQEQLEKEIWNQLRSCYDPEIPVNVVDLGLIYDCHLTPLRRGEPSVDVKMTLTAPGCGMGPMLAQDVQNKVLGLEGVDDVAVELVWDPPWNQGMMTEAGQAAVGADVELIMITEAAVPTKQKKMPNWSALRADFPILDQQVHGQPLIYFDNAATTQKPRAVIEALRHYYEHDNANVHRGIHELSNRATAAFEAARTRAAQFINARSADEIIFTRGTTEGINLVAQAWGSKHLKAGDRDPAHGDGAPQQHRSLAAAGRAHGRAARLPAHHRRHRLARPEPPGRVPDAGR